MGMLVGLNPSLSFLYLSFMCHLCMLLCLIPFFVPLNGLGVPYVVPLYVPFCSIIEFCLLSKWTSPCISKSFRMNPVELQEL